MQHLKKQLHHAEVKAAASMTQLAALSTLKPDRYTVRKRPANYAIYKNGTYHRTSGTENRELAETIAKTFELQAEAKAAGIVDVRTVPAAVIVDFFAQTYPDDNKAAKANMMSIAKKLRFFVGDRRLKDLKLDWLNSVKNQMKLEGYKYGYFVEIINRLCSAIKVYCRAEMTPAIIPFPRPEPADGRDRVVFPFEEERILRWADGSERYDKITKTWHEQEKISKYEANCRLMVGRAMRLGLTMGSRPGIYRGLCWTSHPVFGHLDADRGMFHRLPPGTARRRRKGAPSVKLSPGILAEIRRWRETDGDEKHVFRTSTGGPLDKQGLAEIFASAMDHLGIEGVTGHTLRHTAITRMIERSLSAAVISVVVGITTDMLKRRYDHSDAAVVQTFGHEVMDDLLP